MSEQHTQMQMEVRAWTSHVKDTIGYVSAEGHFIGVADVGGFGGDSDVDEQLARRFVACWNACQGLSTEALELKGLL